MSTDIEKLKPRSVSDRSKPRNLAPGVLPPAPRPVTPDLDEFEQLLNAAGYQLASTSPLVPRDRIDAVRRDVAALMAGTEPIFVIATVKALAESYPQSAGPLSLEGYLAAAAEELREYPADVVRQVASETRRTNRFLPSIAEMRELCDAGVARRRRQLLVLERMETEHRRRAIEDEKQRARELANRTWPGTRYVARWSGGEAKFGAAEALTRDGRDLDESRQFWLLVALAASAKLDFAVLDETVQRAASTARRAGKRVELQVCAEISELLTPAGGQATPAAADDAIPG